MESCSAEILSSGEEGKAFALMGFTGFYEDVAAFASAARSEVCGKQEQVCATAVCAITLCEGASHAKTPLP